MEFISFVYPKDNGLLFVRFGQIEIDSG